MEWQTKIQQLIDGNGLSQMERDCFVSSALPDHNAIDLFMREYHGFYQSYIEFLRLSDGMQLGTFEIYGLGGDALVSVASRMSILDDVDGLGFIPIGHDSSGNVFILNQDGHIERYEVYDQVFLADSFDYLIDYIILGDGYWDYMSGDIYQNLNDDEWYNILKSYGWVSGEC